MLYLFQLLLLFWGSLVIICCFGHPESTFPSWGNTTPNFAWGGPSANTPCPSCSHKENSTSGSRREACDLGSSNQRAPPTSCPRWFIQRWAHDPSLAQEAQSDSRGGSTIIFLCTGCEAQRKARWGSCLHLLTPRRSRPPWRTQLNWNRRETCALDVPASETKGVWNQPFLCTFQLDESRIPFLLPRLGLFAIACGQNNTKWYRRQVDVGYDYVHF